MSGCRRAGRTYWFVKYFIVAGAAAVGIGFFSYRENMPLGALP